MAGHGSLLFGWKKLEARAYIRTECQSNRCHHPTSRQPPIFQLDLAVDTDRREAHRLMQADAGFIRQGNPGKDGVDIATRQNRKQCPIKLPSNPGTRKSSIKIDCDICRGCIGFSRAVRGAIGISRNFAFDVRNQPAMTRAIILYPARHFRLIGRIAFETDPIVRDIGRVNLGTSRRVGGGRRADVGAHASVTAVPEALTISIEPFWPSTS